LLSDKVWWSSDKTSAAQLKGRGFKSHEHLLSTSLSIGAQFDCSSQHVFYRFFTCPGYDVKLHPVTKAQFITTEVLVAMPMTRWEFRIVPCLAGGNASTACLNMLVMRFADVQ